MSKASGFYGTDSETYYVADSGRAWIVQSVDDLGTQAPIEADLPGDARPCDELVTPDEAIEHLRRIEAEWSVKLIGD
jgi:hypothetical protein